MDPLRLVIAAGPLAIYFGVLGILHSGRRPRVITGSRDWAAIAVAVSGLAIVGPLELFFPESAALYFGPWAWLLLLVLYALLASMWIGNQPARLTVYNMPASELKALAGRVALELDPSAVWAGDTLAVAGLELRFVRFAGGGSASIEVLASRGGDHVWPQFTTRLTADLAHCRVTPSPLGWSWIALAGVLGGILIARLAYDAAPMAGALADMLRM